MKKLIASIIILTVLFTSCSAHASDIGSDNPNTESSMSPVQDVRIISLNMSYEEADIEKRRSILMPLLLSYEPDSIGTQENGGRPLWHYYFEEDMPNYERVGLFSSGEEVMDNHYVYVDTLGYYVFYSANYIFYNADKYRCIDWETVWLSETPYRLNSYHGVAIKRTCTWAILENKETGFRYAHVNAHLGYDTDQVNMYQISLVQKLALQFDSLGLPVFITGDFNTSEGSSSYQLMIGADAIDDSKYLAEKSVNMGTMHHGDAPLEGGRPIDYCFVTGDSMDVHEYFVIDTRIDGVELSDHCGIFVHATVHGNAASASTHEKPKNSGILFAELSCRPYVYDFTFTQSDSIETVRHYRIELIDFSGEIVDERLILSGNIDEIVPPELRCTLTGLTPATEYTVNIYAVNILGAESAPATFTFTTPALD